MEITVGTPSTWAAKERSAKVISQLILLLIFCYLVRLTHAQHGPSKLYSRPGHYPHIWCQLTDVILSAKDATFYYRPGAGIDVENDCAPLVPIWPIHALPNDKPPMECDEEHDEGHAFTIFYWAGGSNYFHLNKDSTIPLYWHLHHNQDEEEEEERPETVVLMPTVETSRLQEMDWDTPAFENPSRYWMQIMRVPRTNNDDPEIYRGYARFMKSELHVLERPLQVGDLKVGLISRSNRRRILNEQELLDALRPGIKIDVIKFDSLSIREQISVVQKYAVIIGMNGAGLMNALFRPEHSVAIQLIPYQAELNNREFNKILGSVGPVMEWENKHERNHRQSRSGDVRNANSQGDTIVHVEEFRELVQRALATVKDAVLGVKEEL